MSPASSPPESLYPGKMQKVRLIRGLGHRFDIERAGASPDNSQLHLDPPPLLTQNGAVRVAQAHATDTLQNQNAFSFPLSA